MFLSFWAGLLSAISSYCEATEYVAARAEEEIAVTALLWWCVATSMASKCYVGHHHTFLPQAQATNGTKIPVCASHCGVNLAEWSAYLHICATDHILDSVFC